MKAFEIADKDSSTSAINLNPDYDYVDGVQRLKGQTASQGLAVTLRNISAPNQIGDLITELSKVNDIQIGALEFDVTNKTAAERQARAAAVTDARNKANQYARLSNRALGKVKAVTDENR